MAKRRTPTQPYLLAEALDALPVTGDPPARLVPEDLCRAMSKELSGLVAIQQVDLNRPETWPKDMRRK